MIVVSDSSPLIALAKIDCFSLLQKLYSQIVISSEVYEEVVVVGAGLAGAADTSKSSWVWLAQLPLASLISTKS